MRFSIMGQALWSPGFGSAEAFFSGAADEAIDKPSLAQVPSRMRRATSLATKMSVATTIAAFEDAGFALDDAATIFGSAHGEIQIAVDQMAMMHDGDGRISPARFKNSVHNTAAGLFSITGKNKGFTTAIAAGDHTFAMSLLEALMVLGAGDANKAVLCVAEESLPVPLDRFGVQRPVAVAFALASGEQDGALATVGFPRRGDGHEAIPEGWDNHPVGPALALLQVLREGFEGPLALSSGWAIEVGKAG